MYLQTGSNDTDVTVDIKLSNSTKARNVFHQLSKNQLLNENSVSFRHKEIIAKRSSSLQPTTYRFSRKVDKGQKKFFFFTTGALRSSYTLTYAYYGDQLIKHR